MYSSFLKDIGLHQGQTNPCHFFNDSRSIKGIVHGDDFLWTGTAQELAWLRKKFEDKYECKVEVIGSDPNGSQSARFLNRVISYTSEGICFEPDQRLVEALISACVGYTSNYDYDCSRQFSLRPCHPNHPTHPLDG